MKRIIFLALTAVLTLTLLAAPTRTQAAAADSQAGVVAAAGGLNVRSGTSTGTRILTALTNGSYITLLSKSGLWWYVEYGNGQYGYCHGDYIRTVSSDTAVVNTRVDSLNVRSGPSTSYSRIGALPKGRTVIVLSSSNGWSKILYNGTKTGYVSAQYLAGTVSAPSGYEAVQLNVPDFKQADSRWAWVQIGNSGQNMAKIGCATTGIAMMESYRTGTTIYPDAMAKKLSYTSSGSVYWPSYYVSVTAASGYLSNVYNLLQQGKPVLIGARNYAGTQHWVVITGFSGGSLTASNFTINDPATSARTTLQQFLNSYPTLYKYFYY